MDSQERHELKQNDLAEFLSHFKQWWDKHGTTFLLVLVIAIGGLYGYRWYTTKEHRRKHAAWSAVMAAGTPEALQDVAAQHADVDGAWSRATLDAADSLASQANLGVEPSAAGQPDQSTDLTEEQRQRKLELAEKLYQQVIERGTPLFAANARAGLAAVYESMGEFDKAAAQYAQLQQTASAWPVIVRQAQRQAADLERLKQPVEFRPAPEIPEDAATEADEQPDPPASADAPDAPVSDAATP